MKQLHLQIVDRIPLSSNNYVVHSGVTEIFEQLSAVLECSVDTPSTTLPPPANAFSLFFISGDARSGKTHLSIKIYDQLVRAQKISRLITGDQLSSISTEEDGGRELFAAEALVVDDAHSYLELLQPGESGPFVNLIETFRQRGGVIVLISALPLENFVFDGHVRSRIAAGWRGEISPPADHEVSAIVDLMARQRGLKLGEKRVAFLAKRIGRDFSAVESYFERLMQLAKIRDERFRFRLLGDAL